MRLPILRGRTILSGLLLMFMLGSAVQAGTFSADSRSELSLIEAQVRASQFLSRATFGPTKAELDAQNPDSLASRILELGARNAFEEWIDTQFDLDPMLHHDLAMQMMEKDGFKPLEYPPTGTTTPASTTPSTTNYRHYAWWHAAISAPDQLRQRMAWALAQIFVINEISAGSGSRSLDVDDGGGSADHPRFLGVVDYYDMLMENAFGNYRTVLEEVTYHPVMGVFLSHRGNRKTNPDTGTFPDENYAREVQQLFSIGLYKIKRNGDYVLDKNKDPVPAYDNDDIETFARVFTGLDYYNGTNHHHRMRVFDDRHDTGEKVLHNGTVLPASEITGSTENDITGALDNLFHHQNTAPFISRLLIQRLVKSNPSSRYIDAVAAAFENNGADVRGDFKAVLKEILLNPEAMESYAFQVSRKNLTLTVKGGGTEHSRLQEPVVRYAAFLRAFEATPVLIEEGAEVPYTYLSIPNRSGVLNQEAYRSPSVFNFYRPDHVPQGELQHYRPKGRFPNKTVSAPEFQIMTSVAANTLANTLRSNVLNQKLYHSVRQYDAVSESASNIPLRIKLYFEEEIGLSGDPDALLHHLNILMCHGSLSDESRTSLAGIIGKPDYNAETRAEGAILALLTAPDCAVHE